MPIGRVMPASFRFIPGTRSIIPIIKSRYLNTASIKIFIMTPKAKITFFAWPLFPNMAMPKR